MTKITSVNNNYSLENLKKQLQMALQIEHTTIPPYLIALYSIVEGTNPEVEEILRTVVVEEMLHMVLVANILNSIGGQPQLNNIKFVPSYPVTLPILDGESLLTIQLLKFSPNALECFLAIERPSGEVNNSPQLLSGPYKS
jgi:hypothetical protein